MPGTITEGVESRRFDLGEMPNRELVFSIVGTEDETEVESLLLATAPPAYIGLALTGLSAEALGGGVWKGYARYSKYNDGGQFTFSTGGGTVHLNQSLGTVNSYAAPGWYAPDFQGAIGVTEDAVQGVDVPARVYLFTETYKFADSAVNNTYRRNLFLMTGCMNDDDFRFFAAGECLFMGVSGSRGGDGYWELTFAFAGSPNLTGVSVGTITDIDKFGWDYLWVRYAETEDTVNYALVKQPVAAYVERVHLPASFINLGIGVI